MELYRNASIGSALQDALDELIESQQISREMAKKINLQFDRSLHKVMSEQLTNQVRFKANCKTFNELDNIRRFQLNDMELTLDGEQVKVQSMKLVACDSKIVPADWS